MSPSPPSLPTTPAPSSAPGSTGRRILHATLLVALVTVVVRLLGLVKNQAIAARFGVGLDVEAFFLAAMLPTFALGVLANFLPSALVPVYSRLRGESAPPRALVANLLGWALASFLALSVLLALVWPLFLGWIGAGFASEKLVLARGLFYLLLPGLLLHGTASVWASVLHAEKRFLAAALAPGLVPLSIALFALLVAPAWGAWALAGGHLFGVLLEALCVAVAAGRRGIQLRPSRPRLTPEVRTFLGQYVPLLGGGLLMRSTLVVDQSMAATLPEGSLAALTYANVVVNAVLSITATALGTAILPYFADMAAAGQHAAMKHSLRSWVRLVLLVSIPGTVVLILSAGPLVSLLFERGRFVAADAEAVGRVFACFAAQIPFYATGILYSRVLSAQRENRVLFKIAAVNLVADVGLNLALMPRFGAAGIALSTSLVYLLSTSLLAVAAERRLAAATPPEPSS